MITSGTANNINGSSPSNPAANKATLHFTKISCFHQVEGEGIIDSTKQVRKFVIQSVPDDDDSLFRSIRGFLVFGKIIGVLPFSGVFGRSSNELSFKRTSPTSLLTHTIALVIFLNSVFGTIQSVTASKRNALEIAESIRATLYFIWGFLIYLVFIVRGNRFLSIFHAWNRTCLKYSRKDATLRRDIILIAVLIFTSAILENAVLHLEYFKELDTINGRIYGNLTDNMTSLEGYYWRSHKHWARLIGYNWFFAVLAFIQHKWILYAWNYMDVLLAVFGRAMYFRFKALFEEAEKVLLGSQEMRLDNLHSEVFRDRKAWHQVIYDHQCLCRLLEVVENFFSPVIFCSYATNMFYICLQLLDELTRENSKNSLVHSIYAPWSFLHLIMRIFIVSVCCAMIHENSHKIRLILQECPVELYSKEISRFDKRITSGPPIALTGLGTFYVTPPFMLSILYVTFTFEIVLLQCVPNSALTSNILKSSTE